MKLDRFAVCAFAAAMLWAPNAGAQANLCADPQTSCAAVVPQRCLSALGAGSIAAGGGASGSDDCGPFLNQYRTCLETVALTCSPQSGSDGATAAPALPSPGPAQQPPATAPQAFAASPFGTDDEIAQRLFGQWRCTSQGANATGTQTIVGMVNYASGGRGSMSGSITENGYNGMTLTVEFGNRGSWRVISGQIESEVTEIWSTGAMMNGQNVYQQLKPQIDAMLSNAKNAPTVIQIAELMPNRFVSRDAAGQMTVCTR
ncbi:MAG: hypothetical protein AAFW46_05350 [Pseudomonadota bacterium]